MGLGPYGPGPYGPGPYRPGPYGLSDCPNDLIIYFGTMQNWPGIEDWNHTEILDANNGCVLPAWCDSHTHIVYAGSREKEFVDRIHGLSYAEIAKNGGGILNSANLLSLTEKKEPLKRFWIYQMI